MRTRWIPLITFLALVLVGCGGTQAGQNENPAPSPVPDSVTDPQIPATEQPITSPSPVTPVSGIKVGNETSAPRKIIELVKADLAGQLNLNADQIRVIESKAVEWTDSSLGCPQPDMAYAQVITPGYWIILEADGQSYPYHTDQNEQFILCRRNTSNPDAPLPVIPANPNEIDDGQPWVPVD
jgi:hypothetical protein